MRPSSVNRFTRAVWGLCLCVLGIAASAHALAQNSSLRGLDPADAFGAQPNRTVCPRNKPFKCENGDCVTNPTKCESTSKCPRNKPLRCADGSCVSKPRDCDRRQRCPVARPFLCPDGSCANSNQECVATAKKPGRHKNKANRLPRLK